MRRAVTVGLSGQTGAGKSVVAERLAKYGYFIIDADKIAALLSERGSPLLRKLALHFGNDILRADGSLDRTLLAAKAFASGEQTKLLNELTHPEIKRLIEKKVNGAFFNGYEAVIIDAPQLFESGLSESCNLIISVLAPKELRLERIMQRDGLERAQAEQRASAQLSEDFFREHSDFIITNNGTLSQLYENVLAAVRYIEAKISGETEEDTND